MISRKNFLLGTLGVAGVAACGDDGAGGAGGATSSTTGASTKASASATGSGSTKAASGSSGNGASTTATASGNSSSATGGMFACASPDANIGTNHPSGMEHTLEVPAADVADGAEKTYDITGNSQHMHSITLTAADFTALKANGTVSVTSTQGGMHTHSVTVTCAS